MGNNQSGSRTTSSNRSISTSSSGSRPSNNLSGPTVFYTSSFSTNHPVSNVTISSSLPANVGRRRNSRAQPIRNARRTNTSTTSYPARSSELARDVNRNPFLISCPYSGCGQRMEAWKFYTHATSLHRNDNQHLACPICSIESISNYSVHSGTNLLRHLQRTHYADSVSQQDSDSDSSRSSTEFRIPTRVGTGYVVDVVKEYVPEVECTICFEEFFPGEEIARLECFCVFHKSCIDAWYLKKMRCPVHGD